MKKKKDVENSPTREGYSPGYKTLEQIYKDATGEDYSSLNPTERRLVDASGIYGSGYSQWVKSTRPGLYLAIQKEFGLFFDKLIKLNEANKTVILPLKNKLFDFSVMQIENYIAVDPQLNKMDYSVELDGNDSSDDIIGEILKKQLRQPIENYFYLANLVVSFCADTKEDLEKGLDRVRVTVQYGTTQDSQAKRFDELWATSKYKYKKEVYEIIADEYKITPTAVKQNIWESNNKMKSLFQKSSSKVRRSKER